MEEFFNLIDFSNKLYKSFFHIASKKLSSLNLCQHILKDFVVVLHTII